MRAGSGGSTTFGGRLAGRGRARSTSSARGSCRSGLGKGDIGPISAGIFGGGGICTMVLALAGEAALFTADGPRSTLGTGGGVPPWEGARSETGGGGGAAPPGRIVGELSAGVGREGFTVMERLYPGAGVGARTPLMLGKR
ncbi:MAG: hypothetical protein IPN17_02995 [Deltaproteobacteria bacterium]|nr:hypothetical protein [Deltaproteobacteria bacterium]